jgi:hypothetical protein
VRHLRLTPRHGQLCGGAKRGLSESAAPELREREHSTRSRLRHLLNGFAKG